MGDPSSGSTLVEIAAARALQWNVEFDRGLRNPKLGAQCEAVMKLGPQLLRWSHNCVVTSSSANVFKLEPGQDRVFANAILLRLAETFRCGNNFVRVCVLKVLMLEFKGRGQIGDTFTGENFDKNLISGALAPKRGSCSRALRKFRSGEEGLLTKKRIENHAEMLRRVKSVLDSGDPTSRALAIRVLGCLADLGKDSMDVHNLVLQAVHSPHRQEVTAALFAMGCLSELSDEFARHALQKAFEVINAMETPPQVKALAVRLFARLGRSSVLSLQAVEMGRRIMLRYPLHEIVTTMLISLTMLAAESSVVMGNQVNLLLTYIACDPRMNVRAIALKCLNKLVPQAFCSMAASDDIFNGVFAVVQDITLPSTLHVLALRVIRKIFRQYVATMESPQLLQIISWIELIALCDDWPVVTQALSLLVEMVCDIGKFKMQKESSEYSTELMELSTRICFLLCDQVSVSSVVAIKLREMKEFDLPSVQVEEIMDLTKGKFSTVCVLLAKLVEAYPPVGWQVVDSLAGIMEAFARRNLEQGKGKGGSKRSDRSSDQESSVDGKDGCRHKQSDSETVATESVKSKGATFGELEVLLLDLGRCLSACASCLEYKQKTIEDVHRRLLQLVSFLSSVYAPSMALIPALQSLMKATLAHGSLTPMTIRAEKGPEVEKLADSKAWAGERNFQLLAKSRSTLQSFGADLMQRRRFGICYEVGKQGALSALWNLAHFIFHDLVDKISSEGCYFWLKALSDQSKAEAILQISTDVDTDEQAREQIHSSPDIHLPRDNEPSRDQDLKEGGTSNLSSFQKSSQVEETGLGRFSQAAARAMPILQNSICNLTAGVCVERMFEFPRWVLTLRLEVLECVSELVGLLARISSLDTDAGVIDLEDEWNNNDRKSLGSALRASAEQIHSIASRLRNLSEEYDLLSISFLGIDNKSVGMLSRAALFCSLLTFCSAGVLSPQTSSSQVSVNPSSSVGIVALDLFRRLEQTESEDWDDLLSLAIQSGAGAISAQGFGGRLANGPLENSLVNISRWAVTSVLDIQKQPTLLGVIRGTRLLQEILEKCLCLPWPSPPFFFCTRPQTGVELFLAQAGASAGDTEDLAVVQGSALALSVCLQIINAPLESLLYLKGLVCGFSIQAAESNWDVGDDFGPCSKSGFVVNKPLHPAIVEQLIVHSKMPMVPNSSPRLGHGSSQAQSSALKTKGPAPDLIFSVSLDPKGQGFASCTLDVSQLPCGEYHLILSCLCVDGKNGPWILPLLSTQPTFRIV